MSAAPLTKNELVALYIRDKEIKKKKELEKIKRRIKDMNEYQHDAVYRSIRWGGGYR